MPQVSSDPADIKRAFQRHRSATTITGMPRRSRFVSLFYAAECGLKYLVMMSASLVDTSELYDTLIASLGLPRKQVDLHNLEQLCLAANLLTVDVGGTPKFFDVKGATFPAYKLHEAARYGVKVSDPYLTGVEQWLERILKAVETRIVMQGI